MKGTTMGGRRPNGSRTLPVRSLRCSDEVWDAARRRAAYEGVTISHVLNLMVEGYAQGLLDMPRVRVMYQPPREKPAN